jgi:hypothetical protein
MHSEVGGKPLWEHPCLKYQGDWKVELKWMLEKGT